MAGLRGSQGSSIYSACKHGIIGLTKSAALECVDNNIRINSVCPGIFRVKQCCPWTRPGWQFSAVWSAREDRESPVLPMCSRVCCPWGRKQWCHHRHGDQCSKDNHYSLFGVEDNGSALSMLKCLRAWSSCWYCSLLVLVLSIVAEWILWDIRERESDASVFACVSRLYLVLLSIEIYIAIRNISNLSKHRQYIYDVSFDTLPFV